MKVYEIKAEFYALMEIIENEEFDPDTGELIDNSDDIKDLMKEINQNIETKLDNIEFIKAEYSSNIDNIKKEISRLQARQKSFLKKIESLKDLQKYLMNGDKFETSLYSYGFRKSKQVEIIDDTLIDTEYLKEKVTYTIDKTKIKKAIESGIDVIGAEVIEKQNLSVR